jgi:hypothetical protein
LCGLKPGNLEEMMGDAEIHKSMKESNVLNGFPGRRGRLFSGYMNPIDQEVIIC